MFKTISVAVMASLGVAAPLQDGDIGDIDM